MERGSSVRDSGAGYLRTARLAGLAFLASATFLACTEPMQVCVSDRDCGGGWICIDGECLKPCNRHADCWPPDIGCVNGVCRPVAPQACDEAGDCSGMPAVDACSAEQVCVCSALGLPCLSGQICTSTGCIEPGQGPVGLGVCAAALDGASERYRLRLIAAPQSPLGAGASERHQLRLGPLRPAGTCSRGSAAPPAPAG